MNNHSHLSTQSSLVMVRLAAIFTADCEGQRQVGSETLYRLRLHLPGEEEARQVEVRHEGGKHLRDDSKGRQQLQQGQEAHSMLVHRQT